MNIDNHGIYLLDEPPAGPITINSNFVSINLRQHEASIIVQEVENITFREGTIKEGLISGCSDIFLENLQVSERLIIMNCKNITYKNCRGHISFLKCEGLTMFDNHIIDSLELKS